MEPLRLVIHHHDGTWDFLCNTTSEDHHMITIHTAEVFSRFARALQPLRTLPAGHLAERDGLYDEWHIEENTEQE